MLVLGDGAGGGDGGGVGGGGVVGIAAAAWTALKRWWGDIQGVGVFITLADFDIIKWGVWARESEEYIYIYIDLHVYMVLKTKLKH